MCSVFICVGCLYRDYLLGTVTILYEHLPAGVDGRIHKAICITLIAIVLKKYSVSTCNSHTQEHTRTLLSPTLLMRGAGRSLRMVGTPKVWWVWSGGAPPTTWTTSDEDLYSERVAGDVVSGTPAPAVGENCTVVFLFVQVLSPYHTV